MPWLCSFRCWSISARCWRGGIKATATAGSSPRGYPLHTLRPLLLVHEPVRRIDQLIDRFRLERIVAAHTNAQRQLVRPPGGFVVNAEVLAQSVAHAFNAAGSRLDSQHRELVTTQS